jgi:hypothetical protein
MVLKVESGRFRVVVMRSCVLSFEALDLRRIVARMLSSSSCLYSLSLNQSRGKPMQKESGPSA